MAASFFCASQLLLTDLTNLGYPDAKDVKCTHPNGEPRLKALKWLAKEIDPRYDESSSLEVLAQFWDNLGIHSAEPNKAGHRIPFTASSDRPRDKISANIFLRSAIDLVFAFRRRRAQSPIQWEKEEYEEKEDAPVLSQFDIEAMEQMDSLINQRHILFPNTVHLLARQPAKKRPLQRRRVDTNRQSKVAPRKGKEGGKPSSPRNAIPGRDNILARLRAIQRETQDLRAQLGTQAESDKAATTEQNASNDEHTVDDSNQLAELDPEEVSRLGEDSQKLADLLDEFVEITATKITALRNRTDLATRDPDAEHEMSMCASESRVLEERTRKKLEELMRAKTAVERLTHCQHSIKALPQSAVLREVEGLKQRTECHLL